MIDEAEPLVREVVAHREAGHGLLDAVSLLLDGNPGLRQRPVVLIIVLREAFGLSIGDGKSVVAWADGAVSHEQLEEWLKES